MLLADTVIAFDHARRSLFLIANLLDGDAEAANQKLDEIAERIGQPLPAAEAHAAAPSSTQSNLTEEAYRQMVDIAREHIAAGDIFQVVLSQRFNRETQAEPFDVYRAVRRLNPSPYMFFFDFGAVDGQPLALVGSSPEMFARLEGRTASLRPIAGTRPRSADAAADAALAEELLADPKERAEHVMLVDLGRNDLGRVCEYGTVKVSDFFSIERYSHVMHIVSHVEGTLRRQADGVRPAAGRLPGGHSERRAESARDGDHCRAGAGGARALCRHRRLFWIRRRNGYLPCHSDTGGTRADRSAYRRGRALWPIRTRTPNIKRH